jgi:hypothetical protein
MQESADCRPALGAGCPCPRQVSFMYALVWVIFGFHGRPGWSQLPPHRVWLINLAQATGRMGSPQLRTHVANPGRDGSAWVRERTEPILPVGRGCQSRQKIWPQPPHHSGVIFVRRNEGRCYNVVIRNGIIWIPTVFCGSSDDR